jgi:hypothetical protein
LLALLLNRPRNAEDWTRWSFHHRASHDAIVRAVQNTFSVTLPTRIIDPINFEYPKLFLEANQQNHQDMDNLLGVQSADLEDVDLNDERQLQSWIYLHWQEHQTAETRLGIAS